MYILSSTRNRRFALTVTEVYQPVSMTLPPADVVLLTTLVLGPVINTLLAGSKPA